MSLEFGNTNCTALSYAGTLQAELRYDPLGRLYYLRDYVGPNGITRFAYDGDAMIAEYNNGTTMLRRYVHGTNTEADDPWVQFPGSAIDCPGTRFLQTDPRGSVVALADCWGNHLVTNSYDAYGIPDSATGNDVATKGRFRYTGQMWIPELGMYHYKARVYSPTLGRFLQTDPIGYEDQFNLYAYVGNDPINNVDPDGERRIRNWYIQWRSSTYNARAQAARNELRSIVPNYRDRDSASSTTPSVQAARNIADRYQEELNHVRAIGTGAFQGRSVLGEGNSATQLGRVQQIFSGLRYENPVDGGYHFSGTGGRDAANQAFDYIRPDNVRPIKGGAGRLGTFSFGNGAQVTITARPGGTKAEPYFRLEVQIETTRTGSRISDKSTFKVRYDD